MEVVRPVTHSVCRVGGGERFAQHMKAMKLPKEIQSLLLL
jgi:hypothetical protein